VFAFDPAKKFDVVFNIDMKELLGALGAKPDQIQKILATAEANRKKPVAQSSSMLMPGGGMAVGGMVGGGMAGGGMPGGGQMMMMQSGGGPGGTMPAMPQGGEDSQGGQSGGRQRLGGASGGGGRFMQGMQGLSDEGRQKVREAMQKFLNGRSFQDLTDDDRQKMQKVVADAVKAAGGTPPAAGAGASSGAAGEQGGRQRRGRSEEGVSGQTQPGAEGPRTIFAGGPGGAPGGFGGFGATRPGQFSAKELENAKLPPPPEQDTQFDVLLRPGLLADVEIIVEKVPNAIHLPMQAIFEKEGKTVVYVRNKDQWEARAIKPLKRSESVMIIAEGVKPGETVALADPTAVASDKKGAKGEKSGGAMSALPGGSK
jgi:hypothetical protein